MCVKQVPRQDIHGTQPRWYKDARSEVRKPNRHGGSDRDNCNKLSRSSCKRPWPGCSEASSSRQVVTYRTWKWEMAEHLLVEGGIVWACPFFVYPTSRLRVTGRALSWQSKNGLFYEDTLWISEMLSPLSRMRPVAVSTCWIRTHQAGGGCYIPNGFRVSSDCVLVTWPTTTASSRTRFKNSSKPCS